MSVFTVTTDGEDFPLDLTESGVRSSVFRAIEREIAKGIVIPPNCVRVESADFNHRSTYVDVTVVIRCPIAEAPDPDDESAGGAS